MIYIPLGGCFEANMCACVFAWIFVEYVRKFERFKEEFCVLERVINC